MPRSTIEIEEKIVYAVIDVIPRNWERIVLEMEVRYEKRWANSFMFFYVTRSEEGTLQKNQDANIELEDVELFYKMNDIMFESTKSRWNVCGLVIDSVGRYGFDFDYGPHKILRDIGVDLPLSYHRRFNNYLEEYETELAALERNETARNPEKIPLSPEWSRRSLA